MELRIIAGQWRGRRWRFPAAEGVRPTSDRVRETLFNWLAPRIHGTRCLDLFAGSGALGLEALSRGAAEVVFVDSQRSVTAPLRTQLEAWGAAHGEVHTALALDWLRAYRGPPFDLVFVDPPFATGLVPEVLAQLRVTQALAPNAWVYLEQPVEAPVPPGWQVHRSGRAGAVGYYLLHAA